MKDYYLILGIDPSATSEEIRTAYRKMSKKYHPDHNSGDAYFEERFKDILEAYDVLKDNARRKQYDYEWLRYFKARHTSDPFDDRGSGNSKESGNAKSDQTGSSKNKKTDPEQGLLAKYERIKNERNVANARNRNKTVFLLLSVLACITAVIVVLSNADTIASKKYLNELKTLRESTHDQRERIYSQIKTLDSIKQINDSLRKSNMRLSFSEQTLREQMASLDKPKKEKSQASLPTHSANIPANVRIEYSDKISITYFRWSGASLQDGRRYGKEISVQNNTNEPIRYVLFDYQVFSTDGGAVNSGEFSIHSNRGHFSTDNPIQPGSARRFDLLAEPEILPSEIVRITVREVRANWP